MEYRGKLHGYCSKSETAVRCRTVLERVWVWRGDITPVITANRELEGTVRTASRLAGLTLGRHDKAVFTTTELVDYEVWTVVVMSTVC